MGRWAKNHDQRKGQWLINAIRTDEDFQKKLKSYIDKKDDLNKIMNMEKQMVELRLWNMTNEEFEKIMEKYYE